MLVIGRIPARLRSPLFIAAIFIISRVAFYLAGVRFNMTGLTGASDQFQLLDFRLLQHHLVESIWHLHSQPPLYNVMTALLLDLPGPMAHALVVVLWLLLGLGTALSCFYLSLELSIPRTVAVVITTIYLLDPANVLYGNWYFDTVPTVAVLTFGALSTARYVRTKSPAWGIAFFLSIATLVLFNSTFQWLWLIAVGIPVVAAVRRQWRSVIVVAMVPIALVSVWYIKNEVLFHSSSTSSWLGMNLSKITTAVAPAWQIHALVTDGKATPLAADPPFAPLSTYAGHFTPGARTGAAALDQRTKGDGSPNFNNVDYIAISNTFLHNDLAYIKAYPGAYAKNVGEATRMFFVPSDSYGFLLNNADTIRPYLDAFDLLVNWEPRPTSYPLFYVPGRALYRTPVGLTGNPTWGQVSISTVLVWLVLVLLGPVAAWRRRRQPAFAATIAFVWISSVYGFLISSLVEIGENMRFRYNLGPLPLVGAVAVVFALFIGANAIRTAGHQTPDPPRLADEREAV